MRTRPSQLCTMAAVAIAGLTGCGTNSTTGDTSATTPAPATTTATTAATPPSSPLTSTPAPTATTATTTATSPTDIPSTGPQTTTVESLLACVQAAGLTADSNLADGLDWTGSVSVYSMDAYQQAATVYVFPDAETAQQDQDEVFLDGRTNPKYLLAANTGTVLNREPRTEQPDTAALLACLPAR